MACGGKQIADVPVPPILQESEDVIQLMHPAQIRKHVVEETIDVPGLVKLTPHVLEAHHGR